MHGETVKFANFGAPWKLAQFRQYVYLIISDIKQTDYCKVVCLLQVPWLFISTVVLYTWLLCYTKQKAYFSFVTVTLN